MSEVTKALIAGTEGPFRAGLANILDADPSITIVCAASDGREALNKAVELSPHVVLIDVATMRDDGFEAVQGISDAIPTTATIVLADSEAQEDVSRALAYGARGYLLRNSPSFEIVQAVKRAASGAIVLSPGISARLATLLSKKVNESHLSRRETDILRLLGEGLGNREIADRLVVTVSTVRTYIYRILDKLNLKSRNEATAYAGRLYSSYARLGAGQGQIITDITAPGQIEQSRAAGGGATLAREGKPASAAAPAAPGADKPDGAITGERKQATVLSVELELYPDTASMVGDEIGGQMLRECLATLAEVVRRFGGKPAWFSSHGITALFGVPLSLEHAPHKALHSALAIRERVQQYNQRQQEKGIRIDARLGINTGTLLVVRGANGPETSYVPVADTVTMAEKLRDTAETGSIVASESTYRLTRDSYRFDTAGTLNTKGAGESLSIYRLLGVRLVKSKLDAAATRGLSEFVGREAETKALREAIEKAKAGAGQIIGVMGEAGVGKSRLVLEMRHALPADEYVYLEGGCISYDGAVPYLPLLDILKSYFDIQEGESESVIKDKVKAALSRLDARLLGLCSALYDVLSLEVEDPEYLALELRERKEKIFEAVRHLLIRQSQNRTLIIALEDLRFIDSSTEEFLSYFMGWMANAHIVLILLYRPEYVHRWAGRSCYSQIHVGELNAETGAGLVRAILRDGEVSPVLLETSVGRAGGNPLFIEELVRDLLENGTILKKGGRYVLNGKGSEIHVPDSVESIIAARMDRLEGSLKRTLQIASVIGKCFKYRVLQAVTGMKDELRRCMLLLQEHEFIYERNLFPEPEYIFKHALIQEVAYNSLLHKERKMIHESIGQAEEELYRERLEEVYEVLAHHYYRSDNLAKAYHYLKLSGDKTTEYFSNYEAFYFYRAAISTLKKMPDTLENRRRVIEVLLLMEGPMKLLAYPEGSLEILQDGERLAVQLGDERALAIIYASMGLCYTFKGNSSQGMKYSEYCFEMAERIEDIELMAPIAFDLCSSYTILGDFTKTVQVAPRVLALLERTGRESESFGVAFNFNAYSALSSYYGQAMGFLGDFEEGEALCHKGLLFAQQINNLYSVGFAEMMYGLILFVKGDGKRAAEHLHHALTCGEQGEVIPVIGMACGWLGWVYYLLLGDLAAARAHLERGLQVQRDAGLPMLMSLHNLALGMVHFEQGDPGSALGCIEDALDSARGNGEKWAEGMALIHLGRVLGQTGEPEYERANECILHGIRHCDETGMRPTCALGHLNLGELCAKTGQSEKAIKCLKEAEGMFRNMGMDYWLHKTQSALEKLQA